MGKVLDFTEKIHDKQARAFLKAELERYGENAKGLAQRLDTMSEDNLTAVFGTCQVAETSRLLQRLVVLKHEGADVGQHALEIFKLFMEQQMALAYFYSELLEIDTKEAFPPEIE